MLSLDSAGAALPAGRSYTDVDVRPGEHVSLAVLGEPEALLGFSLVSEALVAVEAHRPLQEDGVLPHVVALVVPPNVSRVRVMTDLSAPARLAVARAVLPAPPPLDLALLARRARGKAPPAPPFVARADLPLLGIPRPTSRDDGYLLETAGRYAFVRADVLAVLREAFAVVRKRTRREPIAIWDASQWDGRRPASDRGSPRHITHHEGRDVDIGLPATDGEPSTMRDHCKGVLVERDQKGCSPGTVVGFDGRRMALLLGVLHDLGTPPLEKVFLDEVYVREVVRALPKLVELRWISAAAAATLEGDVVLRPSTWHTDHVHVRFAGKPARPTLTP